MQPLTCRPPFKHEYQNTRCTIAGGLNRFVGSGGEAFEDAEGFVVVGEQ